MTNDGNSRIAYQYCALRLDDLRGRHRPGVQEHADEGEPHRDLVGDHLRRGAQAAEQRVRRAAGPAGQHDAVDADRRDGEDVEHGHRQVGELQVGLVTEDGDLGTERHHREREERRRRRDDRRQHEDHLVGGLRDDVLLQRQLDAVGEALQQALRPDPVRPDPVLHPGDDPALPPDREQRHHHEEHEDDDAPCRAPATRGRCRTPAPPGTRAPLTRGSCRRLPLDLAGRHGDPHHRPGSGGQRRGAPAAPAALVGSQTTPSGISVTSTGAVTAPRSVDDGHGGRRR